MKEVTLGIIGAENSHSHCIGKICNIDKTVGMRATHIWGETREAAEDSASQAAIPNIVEDWKELANKVDGVMIDHRNGAHHAEVARYFIEKGLPVFVDKPMTTDLKEARQLFDLAADRKVPIATFSLIPLQRAFRRLVARVRGAGTVQAVNTSGPVQMDSPHGGIFFYGFHQVDAVVEILGTKALGASFHRNEQNGVAVIRFSDDRMATMNCIAEKGAFHWRVCTETDVITAKHKYDGVIYLSSARAIYNLIAKGAVPWSRERMLAPIAILEALQRSLVSGRSEEVPAV